MIFGATQNGIHESSNIDFDIEDDLVLCGDIGGTNSRLRIYQTKKNENISGFEVPGKLKFEAQYANENFCSFDAVLKEFLDESGEPAERVATACLAVAGPVNDNQVNFTNRGWTICGKSIAALFGIPDVRLINDFVANGYGLLTLDEAQETVTLQESSLHTTRSGPPMACVGAGTGLGQCFLTSGTNGVYEVYPSEGGHADFAPQGALQVALLDFLKNKYSQKNRVSVERVVSGMGIADIYRFLRQSELNAEGCPAFEGDRLMDKVTPDIDALILSAGDQMGGKVAGHTHRCMLCQLAMDLMFSAFGSELGTIGMKLLPFGGLYVCGGISIKNQDYLTQQDSLFLQSFRDKGRLSPVLSNVPVKLVLAEDIGQRGAHLVAVRMLQDQRQRNKASMKSLKNFKNKTIEMCFPYSYHQSSRSTLVRSPVEHVAREQICVLRVIRCARSTFGNIQSLQAQRCVSRTSGTQLNRGMGVRNANMYKVAHV